MSGRTSLRVACVGALGRMGEQVRALVAAADDVVLSGALEGPGHPRLGETVAPGVRVVDDPDAALTGADDGCISLPVSVMIIATLRCRSVKCQVASLPQPLRLQQIFLHFNFSRQASVVSCSITATTTTAISCTAAATADTIARGAVVTNTIVNILPIVAGVPGARYGPQRR